MLKFRHLLTGALLGLALLFCGASLARNDAGAKLREIPLAALPAEARATMTLIERGGPFPYRRDGIEFQNRERRLPSRPRGYYREYTVPTPGEATRGARRIVSGQPSEYYYTADHYRSFQRVIQP